MTLLLPTDSAELFAAGSADEHGWVASDDTASLWSGPVSLQLGPGYTGLRAADEGGRGPFDPSSHELGSVYLPEDAPAADGMTIAVRGTVFALSAVRLVPDPIGGVAGCLVASVSEVGTWPS